MKRHENYAAIARVEKKADWVYKHLSVAEYLKETDPAKRSDR